MENNQVFIIFVHLIRNYNIMTNNARTKTSKLRDKNFIQSVLNILMCIFMFFHKSIQSWLTANSYEDLTFLIPMIYLFLYFSLQLGRTFEKKDYIALIGGLFIISIYLHNLTALTMTCTFILLAALLLFSRSRKPKQEEE